MSDNVDRQLLEAIQEVEAAGLSVYRPRRKERQFMKVYSEALDTLLPKISPSAFKVFAALANLVGYEDTIVEITKVELMAKTGLGENSVRSGLNELEQLGVMTRIGHSGHRRYVMSEIYIKRGK